MQHPLLHRPGIRYYLLVWGVVILIHFIIFFFYLDQTLAYALADSLVYNGLFAGLGIGLWYVVSFAGLNKDELELLILHVGAAIMTLLMWTFSAGLLLFVLFFF
ncbi:MAG: hypothetical protein AAFU03_17400, partial [Bacteroidota bacterium]